jgi:hypothetical protein
LRSLPSIPIRFSGACLVAILGVWPARADITLPSVPPPQPEPVQTKVYLGESTQIPLSGVSRSSAGLQFTIRRQPSAGKLSDLRMTGPNTALVTYTHDPHAGLGIDQFRYAASAPGIGVSTPATVTINVVERPAAFVAPARLDFPDVAIGHSTAKILTVRNDGGGRIDGRLVVPAPWKITSGNGAYSLGPGESQILEVAFTPTAAGQFADTAEFSHAPGIELGLGGGGYAPIEIAPRTIHVEADGHNEVRVGSFILRNVSDEDRDLRLTAPAEVIVQTTIHIPAKSESQVSLRTRAGFLGALDGKLTVADGEETSNVPLQVAAAPARLTIAPEAVDFGELAVGRTGSEKIALRNVGGSDAKLRVKKPDGIMIDPDPSGEPIAPGASREFRISYARPLSGRLSDTVVIETGELGLRLPVRAVIKENGNSSGELPNPTAQKPAEAAYSDIPPVEELGITRQTKTELDLAWKKSPDAAKYLLFVRTIVFDSRGHARFDYRRLDNVKVRLVRNEARATLVGLRPGEQVTLLVVGVDAAGLDSRPSQPFVVATKPGVPFQFPWLWLALVAVAGLSALIVRERRRVRAASDAEMARMAHP